MKTLRPGGVYDMERGSEEQQRAIQRLLQSESYGMVIKIHKGDDHEIVSNSES